MKQPDQGLRVGMDWLRDFGDGLKNKSIHTSRQAQKNDNDV